MVKNFLTPVDLDLTVVNLALTRVGLTSTTVKIRPTGAEPLEPKTDQTSR